MIYMPYPDYRRSAKCLSDEHLKMQRMSCRRLIGVMFASQSFDDEAWMSEWTSHGDAVLHATDAVLHERRRRGIDERGVTPWMLMKGTVAPPWLGYADWHEDQKRTLLRLDPKHYARMMWKVT